MEKTWKISWTARRWKQSILKEINPEYSLEGLMLKLKLQYFGYLMWRANSLGKNSDAGKDWRQEEKGLAEDEMAGWHHWLNGHEFEQTPGDSEGQGSLVFCSTKSQTWLSNMWMYINTMPIYSNMHLAIDFFPTTIEQWKSDKWYLSINFEKTNEQQRKQRN